MALVLKGAVADFAESVKKHGAAKRILLLASIEADVTTTAQFWSCSHWMSLVSRQAVMRPAHKLQRSLTATAISCSEPR